jgi:hypothetical protein
MHRSPDRGSKGFSKATDAASGICPPVSTGRLSSGYSTMIPKAEASAHGSDITVTQSILKSLAQRIIPVHFAMGSRQKSRYLIPAYFAAHLIMIGWKGGLSVFSPFMNARVRSRLVILLMF